MSTAELNSLLEEFWAWRLRDTPEFATQIGVHDYDDRLDSLRLVDFHTRKDICVDYLNRAKAIEPLIKVNTDIINYQVFASELDTYITGYNYKGFLFPINYLEGIQLDFERLVSWMKFENENDYNKLLSRYAALPNQINEIIDLLEESINLGMTNHFASMDGVLDQFDKVQVPAEESGIFAPFKKFPSNFSESTKESLYFSGKETYDNTVLPAFAKLRNYIADTYMKNLREDIACTSLPNGLVLYQQCIKFHLSVDLTPDQVHNIGIKEVARIEKKMEDIISKLSRPTSIKDFCNNLRSTRDFYYESKRELLQGFTEMVTRQIRPRISKVIKKIPKMELEVKALTGSSNAPACQYLAGSYDGTRPGVFYVNLQQYSTQPKYEMMSLCLHEGEPGHHTQAATAIEKNMPSFRKFVEDRKYSDAPSRFPTHTSYIEGWALYAESLGDELGLYKDLYMKFGHLSEEMFRACRLVVDTGIHVYGWTQETAVEYMKTHSSASEGNIINEVKRYITWPGQACAYKIGQMKISDFRNHAEKGLGKYFDVKEFHDVILSNAGPMLILEKQVEKYIGKVRDLISALPESH